jgi:DNA-binding XRE family transcriptional regulator
MAASRPILTIGRTRYVLVKESEYRKHFATPLRRRNTPRGEAVETVPALEFAARSIGRKISALREKSGVTQLELARLAGLRPETVSRIERGDANPTARTIERLLRAFGVPRR